MTKIHSDGRYDYYHSAIPLPSGGQYNVWNIVPVGSKAPKGGYMDQQYIEKIKKVQFPPEWRW